LLPQPVHYGHITPRTVIAAISIIATPAADAIIIAIISIIAMPLLMPPIITFC